MKRVASIHAKTKNAYSYTAYPADVWEAGIYFLISVGFSDDEIATILRSKYPRYISAETAAEFVCGLYNNLANIRHMLALEKC